MFRLVDSISLANKLVEGHYTESYFDRLYPFTTENISGYISHFDLKDKSLLTVGSSGDQVLNAGFLGCKDITLSDTNIFTKYYYYLKLAALLVLDREEFFKFFRYKDYPKAFKNNRDSLNINLYNRLKTTLRSLDYESYLFWDELLNTYNPELVRVELFNNDEEKTETIAQMNYYLMDDLMYKKSREKLKNLKPNFVYDNVEYPFNTSKHYDIWLSNIGTWLEEYEDIKRMVSNMNKLLNDNGSMLACYLYRTEEDTEYDSEWFKAYNVPIVMKLLKEYNPDFKTFTGVQGLKFNDEKIKDSIILCRKK